MDLNRIPFSEYEGYSVDPIKDTITLYLKHKRYKIEIHKLEQLHAILNDDWRYHDNDSDIVQR